MNEQIFVKNTFRLQIEQDGRIVGDSGWKENRVVQEGFRNYLARALGALAGSAQVSHINVGTGGLVATDATSLVGEVTGTNSAVQRAAVTAATNGSTSVQFTATLSSANSFVTQTENVSNVGLFGHSTAASIFAGNTYTSSSCATNQNINLTYNVTFA